MSSSSIFLYALGVVISWIIFYYVVKAAVRNGIIEAANRRNPATSPNYHRESTPETLTNPELAELQQRYDRGEITFEVYKAEWNRLSN